MAQTRFNFTGTVSLPKADAKRPFVKEMEKEYYDDKSKTKKTRKMLSLNFGVKESDNNMGFVEAFDGEQTEIMTMSADNEKIAIKWANRFDEDVDETVAS